MIELLNDSLKFSFPEIHPNANLTITFQRTLRIPDDGQNYPLPPGLGSFPLRHVDDFAANAPRSWIKRGGITMPMYQSEAMWLNFDADYVTDRETSYPMAVRIAAGKINAVTGDPWVNELQKKPQNYMVAPTQPWLDGYCVGKGVIRQFVAMPLGAGYSAEEQITGAAEWGGLQIAVHPMKRKAFEKRFPIVGDAGDDDCFDAMECKSCLSSAAMGLAPGGRMRQEIYDDPYKFKNWSTEGDRCFVHLANSLIWRSITGEEPPPTPATAKAYSSAGYPWFDYYDADSKPIAAQDTLTRLKSVVQTGKEKSDVPLPENESVSGQTIIKRKRRTPNEVLSREF